MILMKHYPRRARMVQKGSRAIRVLLGHWVHVEHPDPLVHPAETGLKERLDLQATRESAATI